MKDKFRKGDNDNILYVTSRCSNRCVMCCQPPQIEDDSQQLYEHNLRLIKEADKDTDCVCITGGEPTTIGDLLFEYMDKVWKYLPGTLIHLLTNGRAFANSEYLEKFNAHKKGALLLGVPIHADNFIDHELIAGAKNSFHQTLKGLHNLGILGYEIELRVILLKQNVNRLPAIAEFITLNLPFVSQVSFMGIEIIGYADANYEKIWAEPLTYSLELRQAISILNGSKIITRLFNLPLCLLPKDLWPYACKSISTWKVAYLSQCKGCFLKDECCGVFATSSRYSSHIKPFHL